VDTHASSVSAWLRLESVKAVITKSETRILIVYLFICFYSDIVCNNIIEHFTKLNWVL